MIAKTEGIVLNSRKYGETSKIVSLFTKDYGKLSLMAKGARKPKNKFGSSLDPLSYSSINFYYKVNRDLHLLSDSEHIVPFRKLHESYLHLSAGLLIAEAISQTQVINESNNQLLSIAIQSISALNEIKENPFVVSTHFQLKLAEILGFALDFDNAGKLGKKDNVKFISFSFEDGSLIDEREANNVYLLDKRIAKLLKLISASEVSGDLNVILTGNDIKKIQEFFADYFSYHFDKRIKYRTMNLLKQQL